MKFSELDLRYLNGRKWQVLRAFTFQHAGMIITVPAWFVTDFASTPRLLWRVFPPTGRYGKAAVVHDYLYRLGSLPRTTKPQADAVFLAGMKAAGCDVITRNLLYYAVVLFGRSSFHAKHVHHYTEHV